MTDRVRDTPRTDRVARGRSEIASPTVVDVEFARGLEREIAALRAAPVSEEREMHATALEIISVNHPDLPTEEHETLMGAARLLRAPQQQGEPSVARIKELEDALRGLDPYLDQLVCFASTPQEYKPNRAIANARRALAGEGGKG